MIRPLVFLFIIAIVGGYLLGENHKTALERREAEAERVFTISEPSDLIEANYLEVPQIVVSIIRNGRARAYILTEVSLETSTQNEFDALRAGMPRIVSRIRMTLSHEAERGTFSGDGFDEDALARTVRRDINAMFPEAPRPPVESVFFRRLLLQDNRISS